jgi:hypothetical protein
MNLHGRFFNALAVLDFESLGYAIVTLFVVGWALSVLIWKIRRMEGRWGTASRPKSSRGRMLVSDDSVTRLYEA